MRNWNYALVWKPRPGRGWFDIGNGSCCVILRDTCSEICTTCRTVTNEITRKLNWWVTRVHTTQNHIRLVNFTVYPASLKDKSPLEIQKQQVKKQNQTISAKCDPVIWITHLTLKPGPLRISKENLKMEEDNLFDEVFRPTPRRSRPLSVILSNPRENGVKEFLDAVQEGRLDDVSIARLK